MNCNYLQVHLLPYRIISFKYFFLAQTGGVLCNVLKKLCQTEKLITPTSSSFSQRDQPSLGRIILSKLPPQHLSFSYCIQSHQPSSSLLTYLSTLIPSLVFNPDITPQPWLHFHQSILDYLLCFVYASQTSLWGVLHELWSLWARSGSSGRCAQKETEGEWYHLPHELISSREAPVFISHQMTRVNHKELFFFTLLESNYVLPRAQDRQLKLQNFLTAVEMQWESFVIISTQEGQLLKLKG